MSTLLQQLENHEAILLMYLADELPAEDRAEVEQMLANDERLRAEFERLREAHATVRAGIAAMDDAAGEPRQGRTARRATAAVRAYADARLRPLVLPAEPAPRRFPWWGYPLAMAAAVGLLLLIWWQVLLKNNDGGTPGIGDPMYSVDVDPEAEIIARSFSEDPFVETHKGLDEIEQELAALQAVTVDSLSGVEIDLEDMGG